MYSNLTKVSDELCDNLVDGKTYEAELTETLSTTTTVTDENTGET